MGSTEASGRYHYRRKKAMNQSQLQFESPATIVCGAIDPGSMAIVWIGISLLSILAAMVLARAALATC